MSDRTSAQRVRWRLWQQLPLLVALVVLWMLLWGTVSAISLISGILVALLIVVVAAGFVVIVIIIIIVVSVIVIVESSWSRRARH